MTEDEYFITKGGAYYRPKAQGYTTCQGEAGRFSLEDAIRYSHPNGPDGPRDGIRYEKAPPKAQADDELVEIAAKFILGPREPVPPSAKYTLAELQQVYWDQSSEQERKEALWVARAVLAAVTPAIEARVTGEIVAWLRRDDFAATADAIERGDYKESQP